VAGLASAAPAVPAALYGRWRRQPPGGTRPLPRQHRISHPRHQSTVDHRPFRVVWLHPPHERGRGRPLQPRKCRDPRSRSAGFISGIGVSARPSRTLTLQNGSIVNIAVRFNDCPTWDASTATAQSSRPHRIHAGRRAAGANSPALGRRAWPPSVGKPALRAMRLGASPLTSGGCRSSCRGIDGRW
jgi:hypothetical protein